MSISKDQLKSLVGKHVYVLTRNGEVLDGILDEFNKEKIYLRSKAKSANTSAFFPGFSPVTPLVLFDLLAIAETPFFFPFI